MDKQIMYFKIYQDKNNVDGSHYVDTLEGIQKSLPEWRESCEDEMFPVIEPVLMTQSEFEALPEFTGY